MSMSIFGDIEAQMERGRRLRLEKEAHVKNKLQRPEAFSETIEAGQPVRFNTISLPGWIALAERSGVGHVPFRALGELPVASFINMMDEQESDFIEKAGSLMAGLSLGEMLRMEQVAPSSIKSAMGYGRPMPNGLEADGSIDLYDPRFADTLMDLLEDQVRFLARPIIDTRKISGDNRGHAGAYPEEFRAIINGGRLIGVANYYPQCKMTREAHGPSVLRVVDMVSQMLETMRRDDIAPSSPSFRQRADGPGFTLDFITRSDGEILFLEGGPEVMVASHPCSFLDPERGQVRGNPPLHGVALSSTDAVIPFADFGIDMDSLPHIAGAWQPALDPVASWDDPSP